MGKGDDSVTTMPGRIIEDAEVDSKTWQMEYQLAGAADNANRTHKFDCGSSKLDYYIVSINKGALDTRFT